MQEQTSADGPLELHIPADCPEALPAGQQAQAAGRSWQLLGEGAQGAAVQSWDRCLQRKRGSAGGAGAVSSTGQCQKGLGCAPGQQRLCTVSTKTQNEALLYFHSNTLIFYKCFELLIHKRFWTVSF